MADGPAGGDSPVTASSLQDRLERIAAKSADRRRHGSGPYRFPDKVGTPPVTDPPDIEEDRRWWSK